MKLEILPGKYVVAVSGGVDSVVLLHALQRLPGLELVVAHFDHGIRQESEGDRIFVERLAQHYKLPYVYEEGKLGSAASEDEARQARYAFLERARQTYGAQAIITAHHQDDMLETAIMNILRGTGRKGLSSLTNRPTVLRPLLYLDKQEIIAYAKEHNLEWQEDSTNADDKYLRNYIRHHIMPRLSLANRQVLLSTISRAQEVNTIVDGLLSNLLPKQPGEALDRQQFILLPHDVAKELLAAWLRQYGIRDFTADTLERLVVAGKTQAPGAEADVIKNWTLRVGKRSLALFMRER